MVLKKNIESCNAGAPRLLRHWYNRKTRDPDRKSEAQDPAASYESGGGDIPGSPEIQAEEDSCLKLPDLAELKRLFKRPEFSIPDGMNEYDRDFTGFAKLNGILTQELKRSLARSVADQKTDPAEIIESKAGDSAHSESAGAVLADRNDPAQDA